MALEDPPSVHHQKTVWPKTKKLALKKTEQENDVHLSLYQLRRGSGHLTSAAGPGTRALEEPTRLLEIADPRQRNKRAFSEGFILSSSSRDSSSSSLSQKTATPPDTEPTTEKGTPLKWRGLMGRLFHRSPKMKEEHRVHSLSSPSLAELEKLTDGGQETRRHSLFSSPLRLLLDGLRSRKRRPSSSLVHSREDLDVPTDFTEATTTRGGGKRPSQPQAVSTTPHPVHLATLPLEISQEALKEIEDFEAFIERHLEKRREIQFYI